jgi:sugar phosphate isomerase/epimerase
MYKNLNPKALYIHTSLQETINLAKTTGFQGVDIDIIEALQIKREKSVNHIKQFFARESLQVGGWLIPIDWQKESRIPFYTEMKYRKDLKTLSKCAEIAGELGYTRALTWLNPYSDNKSFQENFDWHVERLQNLAEILEKHQCSLALEFLAPKTLRLEHKYEFIHNLEGALELCDAIGTKNVGLLLDSWHWYTSHGTLNDLKQLSAKDVVYVHVNDAPTGIPIDQLKDNIRFLPGETNIINLVGFLRALKDMGYDGPVTPEPFKEELKTMTAEQATSVTFEKLSEVWKAAGL